MKKQLLGLGLVLFFKLSPAFAGIGKWQAHWLWINGRIPYAIDVSCPKSREFIEAALKELSLITDGTLTFVESSERDLDAIRFADLPEGTTNAEGVAPTIGRYPGERVIGLASSASVGTVQHEVLHIAGMLHEEDRADRPLRDENGRAIRYRLEPAEERRFASLNADPWEWRQDLKLYSHFDSGSLMFSYSALRPRTLSRGDVATIKAMYAAAKRPKGFLISMCGKLEKEILTEDVTDWSFMASKETNTYYVLVPESANQAKLEFSSYSGWQSKHANPLFDEAFLKPGIKRLCIHSNVITPSPAARPRGIRVGPQRAQIPHYRVRLDKVEALYEDGKSLSYHMERKGIAEKAREFLVLD